MSSIPGAQKRQCQTDCSANGDRDSCKQTIDYNLLFSPWILPEEIPTVHEVLALVPQPVPGRLHRIASLLTHSFCRKIDAQAVDVYEQKVK
jgi:hypothetical protein